MRSSAYWTPLTGRSGLLRILLKQLVTCEINTPWSSDSCWLVSRFFRELSHGSISLFHQRRGCAVCQFKPLSGGKTGLCLNSPRLSLFLLILHKRISLNNHTGGDAVSTDLLPLDSVSSYDPRITPIREATILGKWSLAFAFLVSNFNQCSNPKHYGLNSIMSSCTHQFLLHRSQISDFWS